MISPASVPCRTGAPDALQAAHGASSPIGKTFITKAALKGPQHFCKTFPLDRQLNTLCFCLRGLREAFLGPCLKCIKANGINAMLTSGTDQKAVSRQKLTPECPDMKASHAKYIITGDKGKSLFFLRSEEVKFKWALKSLFIESYFLH